jgi:hypothetical protein
MKMQTRKVAGLLALLTVGLSACSDDSDSNAVGKYVLGFRTSTDPTADYIVYTNNLASGSISATGNGKEQEGWSYYITVGDTYLALNYDNSIAKGYKVGDNGLTETGQFAFERMDCFGEAEAGKAIAIGAPWGGGSYDCKIQIVDAASVSITKSATTPIYDKAFHEGVQLNAWPTATWLDGNKLYVSFYPVLGGEDWLTPTTDTAYVSVYSYPALQYESTFKDTRTGPIGYYSSQPCVLKDENGDRYTFSSASIAAGFTQSTKPSGILKINKGEQAFDKDYFFNVEALGYRLMGGAYVGNGIVVARVVSAALDATLPPWAAFSVVSAPIHNIAVLDLNAKTIKIVADVPMHGGQYLTPFLLEDGKVWASVTVDNNNAFVYQIDPKTATAVKGARIEGSEIQAFYKR